MITGQSFTPKYLIDKRFIWLYLGICLAVAIFFTDGYHCYATGTEQITQETFIESGTDNGNVTQAILIRDALNTILVSFSQIVCIAIEPFFAILAYAFAGFINALFGLPLDMMVTPLSYPIALFLFSVFVIAGKLLLSLPSTQIFALITYGELEKLVGYLSVIVIGIKAIYNISTFYNRNQEVLTKLFGVNGNETFLVLSIFICFCGACFALSIYYIVKNVILCGEILQLPFAFLPGVSFLFECLKSFIVLILCIVNLIFPIAGFLFNSMLAILAIIVFFKCNYVIDFYRNIYLKPLLKTIGLNRQKPCPKPEYPDFVLNSSKEHDLKLKYAFPVFLIHVPKENQLHMKLYECWWILLTESGQYLTKKNTLAKRDLFLPIDNIPMYFKESFRYLEIFSLDGREEDLNKIFKKPQKDLHFVISHTYIKYYETIIKETQYMDYLAIKENLKIADEERRQKERAAQLANEHTQKELSAV